MDELTVNTKEWLEWRMNGLGASDAPIIMGASEHSTPLQLWDKKFNKTIETDEERKSKEFITSKGHRFEAWARPGIEFQTGLNFPSAMFTHPTIEFLRATLDGWNIETQYLWECKFTGLEKFEVFTNESLTIRERVPANFWDQLMHQLLTTGAKGIYLTCIIEVKDDDGNKQKKQYTLKIDRTEEITEYINKTLAPALFAFWKSIQENVRPGLNKDDELEIEDLALQKLVTKYGGYDTKEKEFKKKKEDVKLKIFKHKSRAHTKCVFDGFRISEEKGKESIDYKVAFDAFIGWIQTVKTLSPGEIVHAVQPFPDEPNMEKYKKFSKPSNKITVPKKKKEEAVKVIAPVENITDEMVPQTVTEKVAPTGPVKKTEPIQKPKNVNTVKPKVDYWDSLTPEQQTIQAKSNCFVNPETEKKVRGWADKTSQERITYLRRVAKDKKTSEHGKKVATELANDLESLPKVKTKNVETIGGITFED